MDVYFDFHKDIGVGYGKIFGLSTGHLRPLLGNVGYIEPLPVF